MQHAFPNMNYANMIEERKLKVSILSLGRSAVVQCISNLSGSFPSQTTFIIATLISTIIGTFTTGMNLFERMEEKRKQKRTDEGQDAKIKELQKQIEDVKKQRDEANDQSKWAVERRRANIRDEDVRDSLARGGPAVGREYDRNYRRFGDRFAEGDGKPFRLRAREV